jgi:hypothetical protein
VLGRDSQACQSRGATLWRQSIKCSYARAGTGARRSVGNARVGALERGGPRSRDGVEPSGEADPARGGVKASNEADLARGSVYPSSEADLTQGVLTVDFGTPSYKFTVIICTYLIF